MEPRGAGGQLLDPVGWPVRLLVGARLLAVLSCVRPHEWRERRFLPASSHNGADRLVRAPSHDLITPQRRPPVGQGASMNLGGHYSVHRAEKRG